MPALDRTSRLPTCRRRAVVVVAMTAFAAAIAVAILVVALRGEREESDRARQDT
jgi:hypothetical protein